MAKKPKNKMPVSERAKIFSPFSALDGLEFALEKKRRELIEIKKHDYFEEESERINGIIKLLKKGDCINVDFFSEKGYISCGGKIRKISFNENYIVVDYTKIDFKDISDIVII